MKGGFFTGCLVLLLGMQCAYGQHTQDDIVVLPLKMEVPPGAQKLGTINDGNNATEINCDYEGLIANAKMKAKAMGGNLVKITKLKDPAFISKCYSISADVYYVKTLPDYNVQKAAVPEANTGYATVYIYRLRDTTMGATSYKIHLDGDSVLCSVGSRSIDSFNIYNARNLVLWAETEKRREIKLSVKPGQRYFVRAGLEPGEIRMIPVLQLMDNDTGLNEYNTLKKREKNADKNYLQQVH